MSKTRKSSKKSTQPTSGGSPSARRRAGTSGEKLHSKKLAQLENLFDRVERAKYVWESTFDAIVHPVMIVDRDYRIQRANLAFAQAAGGDVRSIVGQTCHRIFAGLSSPCGGCPLSATFRNEEPASAALQEFPDGRQYQAASFPLTGKKEDLDLFIVQYRDIREERHLQARLIQSEKMAAVGLLAGGIAHEINNPLSGVLAFAQLALGQSTPGTQLHEDIQEIETSALRCKKIVENLLEFSRQSALEERSDQDLKELLNRILPLMRIQVKEAGAVLETEFEEPLPKVLVNGNQLEQVFLNLTSNACHALDRGGKIKIRAGVGEAGWVRIDFSDNGSGIREEHLSKIFDPFFTTKRAGLGTGLGLSITYSIIQDHGGRIEVESSESTGTTFRIFLPTSGEKPERIEA